MKQCSLCKQWKDESEYYKYSKSKDGLNTRCKSCIKMYQQREDVKERNKKIGHEYYLKVKETDEYKKKAEAYRERKLELNTKWREANREHMKKYAEENKERFLEINRIKKEERKQYYQEHKQEIEEKYPTKVCSMCKQTFPRDMFSVDTSSIDALSYWCKSCQREYDKQRSKLNPNRSKEYYQKNREEILRKRKERNSTLQTRLSNAISKGMYKAIKQNKSEYHWEDLVPYNFEQLCQHLESQFTPEMNWNNFGEYWEIDHIIPQNMFSFTTHQDRDFQICWSLMNLRPLNWLENRQRPKNGSDIPEELKQQILNQKLNQEI